MYDSPAYYVIVPLKSTAFAFGIRLIRRYVLVHNIKTVILRKFNYKIESAAK